MFHVAWDAAVEDCLACATPAFELQQHVDRAWQYTHANPSIQEAEAGKSQVQSHPWLWRELRASLG